MLVYKAARKWQKQKRGLLNSKLKFVKTARTNWSASSEISNNVYVVWNLWCCKSRGTQREKEKFALLKLRGCFYRVCDARMEAPFAGGACLHFSSLCHVIITFRRLPVDERERRCGRGAYSTHATR